MKYDIHLSMDDDFQFKMAIADKTNDDEQHFEGKAYAEVLAKAHSYLLKKIKSELKRRIE